MAFYECISKPNNKFAQKFNMEDGSLKPENRNDHFSDFQLLFFLNETRQSHNYQIVFHQSIWKTFHIVPVLPNAGNCLGTYYLPVFINSSILSGTLISFADSRRVNNIGAETPSASTINTKKVFNPLVTVSSRSWVNVS